MRSITVDELAGFRDALLKHCVPIDLSAYNTIDMCGTGGDGKDTFNISTLASFVVAAAGEKVAKHGNVGVSSSCGSSNVLESLGYKFSNDASKLKKEIEETNFCYMHAPLFNSAMKNVAPVRKELGVKTFFNMLGPMVNPAFPKNQLVGVYDLDLARLYTYIYQQTDKNFCIVHSLDGYDEFYTSSTHFMDGCAGHPNPCNVYRCLRDIYDAAWLGLGTFCLGVCGVLGACKSPSKIVGISVHRSYRT